jgi:hypothetical protein
MAGLSLTRWFQPQVRLLEGPPGSGDEYADALLAHLLSDFHAGDGHRLALQWLYRLFVAEAAEGGGEGGAREGGAYERTLTSLVAGLLSTLPYKDRAVSKLLAAAPQLSACVLVTLDDLCHARVDSLPPPPPVRLDLTRSRESPLGAERASVCKPPLATQKGCWINTDMSVK